MRISNKICMCIDYTIAFWLKIKTNFNFEPFLFINCIKNNYSKKIIPIYKIFSTTLYHMNNTYSVTCLETCHEKLFLLQLWGWNYRLHFFQIDSLNNTMQINYEMFYFLIDSMPASLDNKIQSDSCTNWDSRVF